jgi:hypothetical protein
MQEITEKTEPSSLPLIVVLCISLVLAVLCLIRLWRRSDSVFERIYWSVFVFVPVLGPLLFVAFFHPPSKLSEGQQASVNWDAFYGGGGGLGR